MDEGNNSSITQMMDHRWVLLDRMIRTLVISAVQCTLTTMGIFREQGEAQRLGENSFQIFIYSNRPQIFGTRHLKKYSLLWLSHVSLLVIELVAEEREVDHIPKTLLCNVHPLMMLQGKIKKLFQDIHNSGGNKKNYRFFPCQCGIQKWIIHEKISEINL